MLTNQTGVGVIPTLTLLLFILLLSPHYTRLQVRVYLQGYKTNWGFSKKILQEE